MTIFYNDVYVAGDLVRRVVSSGQPGARPLGARRRAARPLGPRRTCMYTASSFYSCLNIKLRTSVAN